MAKRPVLVTGCPRSGTTWLARLLAAAPGAVLAGREPMNPRERQYALGRTLDGWARLDDVTARQRRALRTAYAGLNPWVYSRYGRRQWAGPLPTSRVVIKDPFALLSLPVVTRETGALPVLVYRHPGAVLVSYRRMGWEPDVAELDAVLVGLGGPARLGIAPAPDVASASPAEAMGWFWSGLHRLALQDATGLADLVVVSHEELALGGHTSGRRLFDRLDLAWNEAAATELSREAAPAAPAAATGAVLHDFDRPPAAVAGAWRGKLTDEELRVVEQVTAAVHEELEQRRFVLS